MNVAGIPLAMWVLSLGLVALQSAAMEVAATKGPLELRGDDLKTPLGIDDPAPRFSWQLRDPQHGAKQTAYEELVASRVELLGTGHADMWASGRIESKSGASGRARNTIFLGREGVGRRG